MVRAMKGHSLLSISEKTLGQWYQFSYLPGGYIDMTLRITNPDVSDGRKLWSLACTVDEVVSLLQENDHCSAASSPPEW